jgi:YHS domain-containing protein
MKNTRFLSFLITIVFVVTLLVPTPAHAYPSMPGGAADVISAAAQKTGTLVVNNTSGGTLYVSLTGPKSYYFSTSKDGKSQFTGIEPGKYTISLSASTCADVVKIEKKINDKVNIKETVCAKKTNKDKKSQKVSSLTVDNRTGGTLYINLTGPKTYYFSTSARGKTVFKDIDPGTYTITVSSSACSGSLSYNKKFNGNVSLKPFVCY